MADGEQNDDAVPSDCPKCEALKEQIAELRGEFAKSQRVTTEQTLQMAAKVGETYMKMTERLLGMVEKQMGHANDLAINIALGRKEQEGS